MLCHVKLTQHKKEYVLQFEKEIMTLPEVTECFHVSGDYDYILKICVKTWKNTEILWLKKTHNFTNISALHTVLL